MDAFVQLNMPYHSENAFVCRRGGGECEGVMNVIIYWLIKYLI